MRKAFVICLTLMVAVGATAAFAKAPLEMPRVLQGADITERPAAVDPQLAVEASADTFVFGPFDFNTGTWQGWTSVDMTLNPETYAHTTSVASIPGGLGNGTTFTPGTQVWIGTLGANACGSKACYPGYQNGANQLLFKSYVIGAAATLGYQYRADSEPGYDFTHVIVIKNGVGCPTMVAPGVYDWPGTETDRDTLATYDGAVEGSELLDLSAYNGQTVCIVFNSLSDGGWSDDDCLYDSADGLFQVDDIAVTGSATSTFESGADGWTFGRVAGIGNLAALEDLSILPNADPCPAFCGLNGKVVTMYDPIDPILHPEGQDERIISPAFDLTVNPSYPVGVYVVQFDVYADLPLTQENFYSWEVRYAPVEIEDCSCLDANDWSPWLNENTVYFGGGIPTCGTAFQFNVSAKVPGHATKLQVAVGVIQVRGISGAPAPGGNQSPYFDNISLRAAKVSAPGIVRGPWDYLQDAYPNASDFATAKSTPAKVNVALNIYGPPTRSRTRLGDSLITNVALSCNTSQHTEVDVIFKVVPGPCLDTAHPWWVAYSSRPSIASGPFAGFKIARCDTAISATNSNAATAGFGTFMGRFHERPVGQDDDGVFKAHTYAGLGDWSTLTGGAEGFSIFPDDLFTPGTIIYYSTHTSYLPVLANGDYYDPNLKFGNGDGDRIGALEGNQKWASQGGPYSPTGTFVRVWNALPHTTTDGTTDCAGAQAAHCFLYVDDWSDRGPQFALTNAFRNLQIGWDQYNVEAPTSSMGNDPGNRFNPTNYSLGDMASGPLPLLLNELYTAILWNTGTNTSNQFSRGSTASGADAGDAIGLLDGWTKTNPLTSTTKYLWITGDGNSRYLNVTGNRLTFLNQVLGTTYSAAQYRDNNSAWGLTLTGLGPDCTSGLVYGLRGNWCPQRRSFNVIATNGSALGTASLNWKYPDVAATVYGSGVQNVATGGAFNFRTQNDAWSTENTRAAIPAIGAETNRQITEWVARSLSTCFTGCFGTLTAVAVDETTGDKFVNSLKSLQNPLPTGQARISFTLAQGGHATVRVYDASGRAVSTVFDGVAQAGENSVNWNATGLKGGVYFYQVESNGFRSAKKIVLVQ